MATHLFNPQTGRAYCGTDTDRGTTTTTVMTLVTCPTCFGARQVETAQSNFRKQFTGIAQALIHDDPPWAVSMMKILDLYGTLDP